MPRLLLATGPADQASVVPQDVFNGMVEGFQADKAKGVHAKYQFELSGPNGGEWWIEVNDSKCKMGKGKIDHPSVTYFVSAQDWVAISNGQLTGWWAYLSGRLKLRGDQALAKRMGEMFP